MEHNKTILPDSLEKDIGQVEDRLQDGAQASQALAQALAQARREAKALAAAGNRVKRVLAGFDQINRLGEKKTVSRKTSAKKEQTESNPNQVMQELEAYAIPVAMMLQGLQSGALGTLTAKFLKLHNAIDLARTVGTALHQIWQDSMVPVGQWLSQLLIPVLGEEFVQTLGRAAEGAADFGRNLYQMWQQLLAGTDETVLGVGQGFMNLYQGFEKLVGKIFAGSQQIGSSTETMGQQVRRAADTMGTSLTGLEGNWQTACGNLQSRVTGMAGGVVNALQSVTGFLQGSFSQNWYDGFWGLQEPTKGVVNGVIGFLNRMNGGLVGAVNGMVGVVNKLKITIPSWVPVIGGKQYGFSLKTVTAPQIPYLAKGAVLPANQPFLAMVGDQRHGTNIEAPLATIQEAVADVMADHTAGNMAGHEATVAVLNRILEAVLGIDVGEAVIARAAHSYQVKESVMKGGGF